jgi:addiction module HigA family antidote
MTMKNPPHPGRIVRQECLEPLGLSVTDGAKVLGVSRNALSEIVNERRGISPEMAIRLDKAFGGGAIEYRNPLILRKYNNDSTEVRVDQGRIGSAIELSPIEKER